MERNFLYMFEFVVDEVHAKSPNNCVPDGYPVCVEISFRSSVYVSISDQEFGCCVGMGAGSKCRKCFFSLESPITDKDRLFVHAYGKKNESCKFLIGAADVPIKPHFDKVTEEFLARNPNWIEKVSTHNAKRSDPKLCCKQPPAADNDSQDDLADGKDQLCPTSDSVKHLLPLYNMKSVQTGNVVLTMRLVCNGPAIMSSFPFAPTYCAALGKSQSKKPALTTAEFSSLSRSVASNACRKVCERTDPCVGSKSKTQSGQRILACTDDVRLCAGDQCEDTVHTQGCRSSGMNAVHYLTHTSPCCPPPTSNPCSRPCLCPCPLSTVSGSETPRCCASAATRCYPTWSSYAPPKRCKGGQCDGNFRCCCQDVCVEDCAEEDSCEEESSCEEEEEMRPCFVCAPRPDPGPDAYEEFQACLNGSGVTIRVNKNSHCVEQVYDGRDQEIKESSSECELQGRLNSKCETFDDILRRSSYAERELKKRVGGRFVNNLKLPRIRANIKYAANEAGTCAEDNFRLPLGRIQEYCEEKIGCSADKYRKPGTRQRGGNGCCQHENSKSEANDSCGPYVPAVPPDDERTCCVQVDPTEISNMLKNVNLDTRKKGIEVCYKTCEETDSDVFMVRLGSKKASHHKQNQIEIELKTPKMPLLLPKQKCTTETQINEAELDAAISGVCKKGGKGKKKGKKGKK